MIFLTHRLPSIFLILLISAVNDSQAGWAQPTSPDNSTILTIGQSFTIIWTNSLRDEFHVYAPNVSMSDTDLWITDFYQHRYMTPVAYHVDVSSSSFIPWRVQVSPENLTATSSWVFRFVQTGHTPFESAGMGMVASPGFFIVNATTAPSPTTSSAPSSLMTLATTSPTSTANTITTPTPSAHSSHLSSGAIAGTAIAVILSLTLLTTVLWFILLRRRGKSIYDGKLTTSAPSNDKEVAEIHAIRDLNGQQYTRVDLLPQRESVISSVGYDYHPRPDPAAELPAHN